MFVSSRVNKGGPSGFKPKPKPKPAGAKPAAAAAASAASTIAAIATTTNPASATPATTQEESQAPPSQTPAPLTAQIPISSNIPAVDSAALTSTSVAVSTAASTLIGIPTIALTAAAVPAKKPTAIAIPTSSSSSSAVQLSSVLPSNGIPAISSSSVAADQTNLLTLGATLPTSSLQSPVHEHVPDEEMYAGLGSPPPRNTSSQQSFNMPPLVLSSKLSASERAKEEARLIEAAKASLLEAQASQAEASLKRKREAKGKKKGKSKEAVRDGNAEGVEQQRDEEDLDEEEVDISKMSIRRLMRLGPGSSKLRDSEMGVRLREQKKRQKKGEREETPPPPPPKEDPKQRSIVGAPKLKIVNGQAQVDHASLAVVAGDIDKDVEMEEVDESALNQRITFATFTRKPSRARWTKEETAEFYQCLRWFGTDFGLISAHFKHFTRRQVKLKFGLEERKDNGKITELLRRKENAPREVMDDLFANHRQKIEKENVAKQKTAPTLEEVENANKTLAEPAKSPPEKLASEEGVTEPGTGEPSTDAQSTEQRPAGSDDEENQAAAAPQPIIPQVPKVAKKATIVVPMRASAAGSKVAKPKPKPKATASKGPATAKPGTSAAGKKKVAFAVPEKVVAGEEGDVAEGEAQQEGDEAAAPAEKETGQAGEGPVVKEKSKVAEVPAEAKAAPAVSKSNGIPVVGSSSSNGVPVVGASSSSNGISGVGSSSSKGIPTVATSSGIPMLPPLPAEIHALIIRSLDPDHALDRRALVRCEQVSRDFFMTACPVLWSMAELNVRGIIKLWCRHPLPSLFRRVVMVDWVVLTLRATDDAGGADAGIAPSPAGGLAWRWWAYLRSVRRLVVEVQRTQLLGSGSRADAELLGPWLGRLDDIEVSSWHGGPWSDNSWVCWLRERWAAGDVPRTLTLDSIPSDRAQTLAGLGAIRNLRLTNFDGGISALRELLASIKHGPQNLQFSA
ncbi:Transcription factor TFIIIB component B [Irineochytrium annulatum]|nr:Transcription factor TFIIIB component B [Irineochytrium annulatum]